jgi:hypothetical protein
MSEQRFSISLEEARLVVRQRDPASRAMFGLTGLACFLAALLYLEPSTFRLSHAHGHVAAGCLLVIVIGVTLMLESAWLGPRRREAKRLVAAAGEG